MKPAKDVWTAHLPIWREHAAGRLRFGTVYLVVRLDHPRNRLVNVEITSDEARELAIALLNAAGKADDNPPDPVPVKQLIQQLELDWSNR